MIWLKGDKMSESWIQTLTIIGTLLTTMLGLFGLTVLMLQKMDSDIKALATILDGHANRIDQLYIMFAALVKSKS